MTYPGHADRLAGGRQPPPATREIHLRDLLKVVARHWRLVALLAALAAVGAWWSGRDAIPQYRSHLTVQISSPKQVFARVDDIDVDELALRTDPVLSEALILTTQRLALQAVESMHLRLELSDPFAHRGDVLAALSVDSGAPNGRYVLTTTDAGRLALEDASGTMLWTGVAGEPVRGPGFTFGITDPESIRGSLPFRVVSSEAAAARVTAGIWYGVRTETNAVDITFTGTDPTLVPHILNQIAVHLRRDGAERARTVATQRTRYVADQLARADEALQEKLREFQAFKEGQQITDLSAEEQAIVSSIQSFEQQRQQILIQISTLRNATSSPDEPGIDVLNRLAALEGTGANTAVTFQLRNLLELYEERGRLMAGPLGLREDNPQVDALNQRLQSGHQALETAVGAALRGLQDRQAAIESKVGELRTELGTYPGKETRIAQLEIERGILHDTYSYLLGQYQQAQMQEASIAPYVSILDGASPPDGIGTDLRQKVILGVLVGLLLGLAGAFLIEYFDQTIKTAADVERVIGVPVLGLIPYQPKSEQRTSGAGGPLPALTSLDADDPSIEAFRSLRTNVTFVAAEKPVQLIAVTSPGPGEGKSTTALNLALALAQSGSKVLLVDGDLRRPTLHRALQLVNEPGLTDVLVDRATLKESVRPDVGANLDVLPSGPKPPNPSELLGSDAMRRVYAEIRRQYDYVVVDTPPVLPVTDASVVATSADGMILVLRSGDTEEAAARRACEQLHRIHARIAGVVLNGVTRHHETYYAYYAYGGSRRQRSPGRRLRRGLSRVF